MFLKYYTISILMLTNWNYHRYHRIKAQFPAKVPSLQMPVASLGSQAIGSSDHLSGYKSLQLSSGSN
jgi:hypothetical protein